MPALWSAAIRSLSLLDTRWVAAPAPAHPCVVGGVNGEEGVSGCFAEVAGYAGFEDREGTGGFVDDEGTGGGVDLAAAEFPLLAVPFTCVREALTALPPVLFGVTLAESELKLSASS
jgi:hypothetical protein